MSSIGTKVGMALGKEVVETIGAKMLAAAFDAAAMGFEVTDIVTMAEKWGLEGKNPAEIAVLLADLRKSTAEEVRKKVDDS